MGSSGLVLPLLAALAAAPPGPRQPPAALPATGSAGTLVVLNKSDDTASLVDLASGETRHVVPTGRGPHEVAVAPDGLLAVVADYGHGTPGKTLTLIDVARGEALRTIDLGDYRRPHGLAFAGPGRLLVTAETEKALVEVDLEAGEVVRAIPTGEDASHMVAVTPDGARAFVANIGSGTVSAIDLAEGELLANVPAGAGCEGIAVTPDGREVWASNRADDTLTVIDAASLEVLATLDAPGFPIRLEITPDGRHALVSCARAGEVAVFDVAGRRLVRGIRMRLAAADGSEDHLFGDAFGGSPVPIGIEIHPDGGTAWVANSSANRVAVVDLASWEVTGFLEAGQEPDGLGWAPPPAAGEDG